MGTIWDKIVKALAAAAGAIGGLFGGLDWVFGLLLGIMVADYISGVLVGAMHKSLKTADGGLSSKVGWIGLGRKGLMLMVVLVAVLLDKAIGTDGGMFRNAVCWFYIANEGISVMENYSLTGLPFPKILKKLFEAKLAEDEASGDEDTPVE